MTIHGSKLELQRLKYPENRERHISMLPEAITFYPTIGFLISLVLWKLDIQSFLETPKLAQFESGKTFKYVSEVEPKKDKLLMSTRGGRRPYEVRRKPKGQFSTIKASKPLILQQHQQKKRKKILGSFLGRFSLSLLYNFSPKHILSTTKRLCFFSFHHNYKVVFLYPIFLSLVLYLVFEV